MPPGLDNVLVYDAAPIRVPSTLLWLALAMRRTLSRLVLGGYDFWRLALCDSAHPSSTPAAGLLVCPHSSVTLGGHRFHFPPSRAVAFMRPFIRHFAKAQYVTGAYWSDYPIDHQLLASSYSISAPPSSRSSWAFQRTISNSPFYPGPAALSDHNT